MWIKSSERPVKGTVTLTITPVIGSDSVDVPGFVFGSFSDLLGPLAILNNWTVVERSFLITHIRGQTFKEDSIKLNYFHTQEILWSKKKKGTILKWNNGVQTVVL